MWSHHLDLHQALTPAYIMPQLLNKGLDWLNVVRHLKVGRHLTGGWQQQDRGRGRRR